ncbi:MAG TPA: biotin/lipoyl-binding protein [Bacteroidales bacterium]|jgi:biotin carboxyl carrier protein|nr:biotin/lipoyl-binding protein [Bacteroidales bacterium]HNY53101.1 biotin/lipoyl-binding protein [Bacteroidales bacterium]HOG57092.1 biotin/lipoyl-binding protein [Bacteroidales bacterium]HPB13157.1 biotin/lipoyl-binding protein [Bacteroidales bacterium]HPX43981.1 biotin/lipoyl-binding protein [Bacteroidales bacterium]
MEDKDTGRLNIDSTIYTTRLSRKFLGRKPWSPADPGSVVSYIPGTVLDILVKEGQAVKKGEDLIILEAMKMQNFIKSVIAGRIKKITVEKGDRIGKGTLLLEIDPD